MGPGLEEDTASAATSRGIRPLWGIFPVVSVGGLGKQMRALKQLQEDALRPPASGEAAASMTTSEGEHRKPVAQ